MAMSMEWRVISSCAFAVNASASASNVGALGLGEQRSDGFSALRIDLRRRRRWRDAPVPCCWPAIASGGASSSLSTRRAVEQGERLDDDRCGLVGVELLGAHPPVDDLTVAADDGAVARTSTPSSVSWSSHSLRRAVGA